jgi:DNA-binding transcriptional MerR regulator
MTYTISQVAELTCLSPYTLRYYDREGLLPFVARSEGGIRRFTGHDLEMLSLICCLKSTGMSVKQIRQYIDWYTMGDSTLQQRRDMLSAHRSRITTRMAELQSSLDKLDVKLNAYDDALAGCDSCALCVRASE